ncbi:hypothetical protein [Microvirga mediterraneensis]|uniref:Uncharacterized protein n=1 Tax=Microvirga mediterraneensis TaxID=2754695 RepID=A0A838BTH4_9HYPH|nr:hypothetical protein [Microvirga mediterraneensis]MBA1158668.1 hypothetical protein [Microvirga mediterraneensis]
MKVLLVAACTVLALSRTVYADEVSDLRDRVQQLESRIQEIEAGQSTYVHKDEDEQKEAAKAGLSLNDSFCKMGAEMACKEAAKLRVKGHTIWPDNPRQATYQFFPEGSPKL